MKAFFLFLLFSFFFPLISPVFADFLFSPNYQIEAPNVNIGSDTYTSPTSQNKISSTLGQTAAEKFSSTGYVLRAGFQYIKSIAPFSFTISNTNIAFGSIIPGGGPSTATTSLTVGFSSANGYQVTAIEGNSLQTLSGSSSVSDTSCDSGTSCTISSANTWSSSSTFGFGYTMSSTAHSVDLPSDFSNGTKYRPFANAANSDSAKTVMTNTPSVVTGPTHLNRGDTRQATMTFKLNVASTQTAGTYTTVVRLTATPLY